MSATSTTETTVRIRFIDGVDGYETGHELDVTPGIADAYVNWRRAAVYVETPRMEASRRDKMMRRERASVKA